MGCPIATGWICSVLAYFIAKNQFHCHGSKSTAEGVAEPVRILKICRIWLQRNGFADECPNYHDYASNIHQQDHRTFIHDHIQLERGQEDHQTIAHQDGRSGHYPNPNPGALFRTLPMFEIRNPSFASFTRTLLMRSKCSGAFTNEAAGFVRVVPSVCD